MSEARLEIDVALRRGDFTLQLSEAWSLEGCLAVYGPSGAGKSTLLRVIAGFERPHSGRVVFDGDAWVDMRPQTRRRHVTPAHRRGVGLVFQDGRLFPHLSVEGNLRYAERRSRNGAAQPGFDDVVDAFALAPLLARAPEGLSGGERQRVALGRALLARPRLLLLDEPLSALDRARRGEILPFLDDLPSRFGIPIVYVSHNAAEVARLADRTVVLKDGRVRAAGPTAAMLNANAAPDDSETLTGTVLEGVVVSHDPRFVVTRIDVGAGVITTPLTPRAAVGDRVRVRVAARHVALATSEPDGLSIRNRLPSTIVALTETPNSPFVQVELALADVTLRAEVTREAVDALGLAAGAAVTALIKSASLDV